jgi:hypothetical protein
MKNSSKLIFFMFIHTFSEHPHLFHRFQLAQIDLNLSLPLKLVSSINFGQFQPVCSGFPLLQHQLRRLSHLKCPPFIKLKKLSVLINVKEKITKKKRQMTCINKQICSYISIKRGKCLILTSNRHKKNYIHVRPLMMK